MGIEPTPDAATGAGQGDPSQVLREVPRSHRARNASGPTGSRTAASALGNAVVVTGVANTARHAGILAVIVVFSAHLTTRFPGTAILLDTVADHAGVTGASARTTAARAGDH